MHSKKVLLVGEAPFLRAKLADELMFRGYEVEQCARGLTALDRLRAGRPQLLILQSPEWITPGGRLTSLVREDPELSDTPILAVATSGRGAALEDSWAAGADAMPREELARILEEVRQLIGPAVDP